MKADPATIMEAVNRPVWPTAQPLSSKGNEACKMTRETANRFRFVTDHLFRKIKWLGD